MSMWVRPSFNGENPFGSFRTTSFSQFSTFHWMSFVTAFLSQSSTHVIHLLSFAYGSRMGGWRMMQSQAPFHPDIHPSSSHLIIQIYSSCYSSCYSQIGRCIVGASSYHLTIFATNMVQSVASSFPHPPSAALWFHSLNRWVHLMSSSLMSSS